MAVLLMGFLLSCGTSDVAGPDGAPLFKVELEDYSSSYDSDTSLFPIEKSYCVTASNDTTVMGMDIPGEWILVSVDVPEEGVYRPYLDYASTEGAVIAVKLEMAGCGASTTADFLLTDGTGLG